MRNAIAIFMMGALACSGQVFSARHPLMRGVLAGEAVAGAPTFPTLTATPYFRYEADQLPLANGNAVSRWTNTAYAAIDTDWVQGESGKQPYWTNNAIVANGRAFVRLTGTATMTNLMGNGIGVPYHLFAVASISSPSDYTLLFSNPSEYQRNAIGFSASAATMQWGGQNAVIGFAPTVDSVVLYDAFNHEDGAATVVIKTNGVTAGTHTGFGYVGAPAGAFQLVHRKFAGAMTWDIFALVGFTNVLSATDSNAIVNYLNEKY